ncbi:MAG: FxLYD domain-containing protein [Bryobacteraceae bacterium]
MGNKSTLIVALLLALAGCTPPATSVTPLTPEAKEYVRYLDLSGVQMKSTETYLKQTVTEIEGNIQNQGNRALQSVEIVCVFYDAYGQVVLRERVPIVRSALKPGATKAFRLAFDNIPESWNKQMPRLVIAAITFA